MDKNILNNGDGICFFDEKDELIGTQIQKIEGEKVFPIAGDDAHEMELAVCCFTMVKAENLNYETVMTAFENGDFYSSNGPKIYELYIEDGIVHISCSDVVKIFLTTERRVSFRKISENYEAVNEAEFDLNDYVEKSHLTEETYKSAYFRITLFDIHGNQAHTRAYFLTDLFD